MTNLALSDPNIAAIAAYVAARLSQDGATITTDQAVAEMVVLANADLQKRLVLGTLLDRQSRE